LSEIGIEPKGTKMLRSVGNAVGIAVGMPWAFRRNNDGHSGDNSQTRVRVEHCEACRGQEEEAAWRWQWAVARYARQRRLVLSLGRPHHGEVSRNAARPSASIQCQAGA